jgi:hypothetical protein
MNEHCDGCPGVLPPTDYQVFRNQPPDICPGVVCATCDAKDTTIATLTTERDDLLDGHNKYSSDPMKCCVPMTDFLRVKNERDALKEQLACAVDSHIANCAERDALVARVRELEQHIALIENGLANAH